MATGALVIRWGPVVLGREGKALEVFGKATAHFDALAKSGRVHGHAEYFGVTGRTGGFMIVEGELPVLAVLQTEEDQLRLVGEAATVATDLDVQLYEGGSETTVSDVVRRYAGSLANLGYL